MSASAPLTEAQKIKKLPFYVAAMTMNSVFTTLTVFGSIFPLYLNELNLSKAGIGVVLALIPYATLISPLVAPFVSKWGYRRTFLRVWTARKFIVALMLLAPVFLALYGTGAAFAWVSACVIAFALCRATGDTGLLPWTQELVPNDIRGKFMAVENIVVTIGQIVVVAFAGYMLDRLSGYASYTVPMALGVAAGLVGVVLFSFLPGGAPTRSTVDVKAHTRELRLAFGDRNFVFFMLLLTLVTLSSAMSSSFIPLFAKEQIGLSSGNVVLLSIGAAAGTLLSSYPVGWASDRFGSKPLMILGLAMMFTVPLFWLLVPRGAPMSVWFALGVSCLGGIGGVTWSMSWSRFLFNTAVPPQHGAAYLSVYYAWSSLVAGTGPLLAGALLTVFGQWTSNPYAVLFGVSLIPMVIGGIVLSRLRDQEAIPLRQIVRRALARMTGPAQARGHQEP